MNSTIERLTTLRVDDVMTKVPLCVAETTPIHDAAEVLERHRVTGVPVVDSDGHCVGVLSGTDFVRRESADSDATTSTATDLVADHMTPNPLTVANDATMTSAARTMCAQHIHRLVVTAQDRKPIGIVSSLDVVAALIGALDE